MWKLLYTYDKIINEYNKSAWKLWRFGKNIVHLV